MILSKGKLF